MGVVWSAPSHVASDRLFGSAYIVAGGKRLAVNAMVARTEADLGPISILVNNAGIAWAATLETWEPEGLARLRVVNVDGTIHAIRAVMAGMKARNYGRIVNISSVASFGATGFTRTDMTKGGKTDAQWREIEAGFARVAITGRVGEPEDIANAVTFIAAPDSDWITAQVITVDGRRMDYLGHG